MRGGGLLELHLGPGCCPVYRLMTYKKNDRVPQKGRHPGTRWIPSSVGIFWGLRSLRVGLFYESGLAIDSMGTGGGYLGRPKHLSR